MDDRQQHIINVLIKAQQTYGYTRQITVTIEELLELATALTKYVRYESHEQAVTEMHDKVVDEFADVMVVLNHVATIFKVDKKELEDRMDAKIARVERWLEASDALYQSTKDREVD